MNPSTCTLNCNGVLAETGCSKGFLAANQKFSMRPIRETKSQPQCMVWPLRVGTTHHCRQPQDIALSSIPNSSRMCFLPISLVLSRGAP